jgi:hypothetical protein
MREQCRNCWWSELEPQKWAGELAGLGKRSIPIAPECWWNPLRSVIEAHHSRTRWLRRLELALARSTTFARRPTESEGGRSQCRRHYYRARRETTLAARSLEMRENFSQRNVKPEEPPKQSLPFARLTFGDLRALAKTAGALKSHRRLTPRPANP